MRLRFPEGGRYAISLVNQRLALENQVGYCSDYHGLALQFRVPPDFYRWEEGIKTDVQKCAHRKLHGIASSQDIGFAASSINLGINDYK
jgi:hypothetical protein